MILIQHGLANGTGPDQLALRVPGLCRNEPLKVFLRRIEHVHENYCIH